MFRKSVVFAAVMLVAGLYAGTALAGGIPMPAKGHAKHDSRGYDRGHSKHGSQGYERGYAYGYRGYSSGHRGHGYGHSRGHGYGHSRDYGYSQYGYGYSGYPSRVVEYSRYEVHRHGPGCGHHGYSRSSYHGYSRYSPYDHHGYRDYGRAAFGGRSDGVRYWVEFDY